MVATSIPQLDTLNIICQNQYPTGSSSMRTASASLSWLRRVSGMSIIYSKWQKIDVTKIFYCLRQGSTCLCQIILLLILTLTQTRIQTPILDNYDSDPADYGPAFWIWATTNFSYLVVYYNHGILWTVNDVRPSKSYSGKQRVFQPHQNFLSGLRI